MKRYKNVKLFFLPSYSPEYNPVEQVWKWFKQRITSFGPSKDGIKEIVQRFRKISWHWQNKTSSDVLNIGLGKWLEIFINIYAE